ncbi:hypothetical protein HII12_000823 [Brettanomyces bruxellensis]|uniref:GDS1 winged helix domain-containing protein n=1 Tax=Dekkera bruxellensis TaxID=5007 RepID=A0A8H6BPK6_DEKBR|nr:hypothetical protein HII12_000823 [Brettanomyces bruxellensis]
MSGLTTTVQSSLPLQTSVAVGIDSLSEQSSTPSSTQSIDPSTAATSVADPSELVKPVSSTLNADKVEKKKPFDTQSSASRPNSHTHMHKHYKKNSSKKEKEREKGEEKKVRPTAHPSLSDDVLMAIFEILHDEDTDGNGMTVKHICDILIKKHPEMANLSSKTSNLVSAKLNAYVKRIEKGDKRMKYALSRVWANTSPRRMLYIYRGVLADNYPEFVHNAIEKLRLKESIKEAEIAQSMSEASPSSSASPASIETPASLNSSVGSSADVNMDLISSPFRGGDRNPPLAPGVGYFKKQSPFQDAVLSLKMPQLSVPYSSAPVTASLNTCRVPLDSAKEAEANISLSSSASPSSANPWLSLMNDSEEDEEDEVYMGRRSSVTTAVVPSTLSKRSKSMSFIQSKRPRTSKLTAASMTPRIPKKQSIADSPSASAAVAALRVSALSNFYSAVGSSARSKAEESQAPRISNKWLETVRSGFLNQDIESPENVSLAELDGMFA